MGRFGRSWQLTKMSFSVIRKDKEILLFPIISGVVSIIILASFFGVWFFFKGFDLANLQPDLALYILLVLFYFISYFVVIFFNVALVACAMKRMEGGDPNVSYGLHFAASRLKVIVQWALLAATVGLILRTIGQRAGVIGKIIVGLIGAAWSIVTYFVVPVIAFEGLGPFKAIKRSGSLLRQTWGEALLSNLGLGLIFVALALIGLVPLVLVALTQSVVLIIMMVVILAVYWLILAVLASAATTVLNAALYRYATKGAISSEFPEQAIRNPWSL
jgi:hypothetical protein